MFWHGQSLADLADRVPTPAFIFSERAIRANYRSLAAPFDQLTPGVRIDYCVKTNYERPLLSVLRGLGAGAMVSCDWEIKLALDADFRPEQISFHGPCKTQPELELAMAENVGLIHLYTPSEAALLTDAADSQRRQVDVSIRLALGGARIGGWYGRRLGVHPAEGAQLFRALASSKWLRPRGFSVHLGTQLTQPGPYLAALRTLVGLAETLSRDGIEVREIDLGGGWPSDTLRPWNLATTLAIARGHEAPSGSLLAPLAAQVAAAYRRAVERSTLVAPPALAVEPGRGLIGSAGVLLTRVARTAGRWAFVDGSRNLLPESWLVGRRVVLPVRLPPTSTRRRYHLSGRTLNSTDLMALAVSLPPIESADVLAFLDAGAYSLSRATRYAGSIPAASLLRDSGDLAPVRREDRYEDIVAAMAAPLPVGSHN